MYNMESTVINPDSISITHAERLAHQHLTAAAAALRGEFPAARRCLASASSHMHLSAAASICGDHRARYQHLARAAHEARAAHRGLAGLDADGEHVAAFASLEAYQALLACVEAAPAPTLSEVTAETHRLLRKRSHMVSRG